MKKVRLFYVVFIVDGVARACIEAIRTICDPSVKYPAHLTVRGPHHKKIDTARWNDELAGNRVGIGRVGSFLASGQNTVFFECESPGLKKAWWKPDYPDFRPHITVYDGSDPVFARKLFAVMNSFLYDLSFQADRIELLEAKHSVRDSGEPLFDHAVLKSETGLDLSSAAIARMSNEQKLRAIEKLCAYLANHPNALAAAGERSSSILAAAAR